MKSGWADKVSVKYREADWWGSAIDVNSWSASMEKFAKIAEKQSLGDAKEWLKNEHVLNQGVLGELLDISTDMSVIGS